MKQAIIKALIVPVPSYIMAFLTEQMVYVVPMLAATGFLASSIDFSGANTTRRVDDDGDGDGDGQSDGDDALDGSGGFDID